ncbi:M15 family metallopeptidase [Arthrobacter sp. H14]|uniref:M15 family metallopeptidase n=1 Tax=Arthrobacter sp. H14 TaxID=1312959 RepID=UPI0004B8C174|nr:M15 family metallopeptidase [Arthrobacter sp. H14]
MDTPGGVLAFTAFLRKTAAWSTTAALALSLAACSGQPEETTTAEATTTSSSPGNNFGSSAADGGTDAPGDSPTGISSSSAPGEAPHGISPFRGSDANAPSQPRPAPDPPPAPGSSGRSTGPPLRNDEANSRFVTVDNPSSLSVVVNKQRPLFPLDYAPSGLVKAPVTSAVTGESALLRDDTAAAAGKMFDAAAADGINLTLLSGYRSYRSQLATYNRWVIRLGSVAEADRVSARPGYSEHQTGLALDIGVASGTCSLQPCFADLPAAEWARDNAHKFGYIVRHQPGYYAITGFTPEPWHLRYIGVQDATAMKKRGIHTLEEYFGLPPAPRY